MTFRIVRAFMPFGVFMAMLAAEYCVRRLCHAKLDPPGTMVARAFMAALWFWIGSLFFGARP